MSTPRQIAEEIASLNWTWPEAAKVHAAAIEQTILAERKRCAAAVCCFCADEEAPRAVRTPYGWFHLYNQFSFGRVEQYPCHAAKIWQQGEEEKDADAKTDS